MRCRVVRFKANRQVVTLDRFFVLLNSSVGVSLVVIGFSNARPQGKGFLVTRQCRLKLAELTQDQSQVGVKARHVWIQSNGLVDQVRGQRIVPFLVADHAKQMPGIGVRAIFFQEAGVDGFRLCQMPLLVERYGLG